MMNNGCNFLNAVRSFQVKNSDTKLCGNAITDIFLLACDD